MQYLHKLTHTLLTIAALTMMSVAALAADPGTPGAAANDQAASWLLVYNIYTSSAANPTAANTRISITNAHENRYQSVHLFFVDGGSCAVADSYVCLTPNQTMTFYASDVDPGVTGFIYAVATDDEGRPDVCARLIGDEQVKFETGHHGSLGAEALQIFGDPGATPPVPPVVVGPDMTADINFRGPRVLAIANIPSLTEGNDVKVVVNRLGGDMRTSNSSIGSIFGILYDELENPYSWTSSGGCQVNSSLNNTNFPRTTPRINTVIPAGSVGWAKFWATSNVSIIGSVFFQNPAAAGYNGAENLHKLTIDGLMTLRIPVFPSNCGFGYQPRCDL